MPIHVPPSLLVETKSVRSLSSSFRQVRSLFFLFCYYYYYFFFFFFVLILSILHGLMKPIAGKEVALFCVCQKFDMVMILFKMSTLEN